MATIAMGVSAQARSAATALALSTADTAKMLAVISGGGMAARDVQTSGLSIFPVWNNRSSGENPRPSVMGYNVNNQVTIRVRDLDRLGAIMDAVVSAGANQFNGLSFGLQDPVPAADIARGRAVDDAARKARLYAEAAGFELGRIPELSEASMGVVRPVQMREMAMAEAVPIAQGEVSAGAYVTIVYEIRPLN